MTERERVLAAADRIIQASRCYPDSESHPGSHITIHYEVLDYGIRNAIAEARRAALEEAERIAAETMVSLRTRPLGRVTDDDVWDRACDTIRAALARLRGEG